MTAPADDKGHPLAFFVLVSAMSAPFWLFSLRQHTSRRPDNIPFTDIGAFGPKAQTS